MGYRYEYKKLQRQAPLVLAAEAAEVEVLVTFTKKAQPDTTDFCQVQ